MTKSTTIVTAAVVRAFFNADEKRLSRLSPEARKTVEPGCRGRMHPEAVEVYNKGRRPEKQYVPGAGSRLRDEAKATAQAKREALRAAGFDVPEPKAKTAPKAKAKATRRPAPKAKPEAKPAEVTEPVSLVRKTPKTRRVAPVAEAAAKA